MAGLKGGRNEKSFRSRADLRGEVKRIFHKAREEKLESHGGGTGGR